MGLIKRDKKSGGALGKLRGQAAIHKVIDDGSAIMVGKQESLVLAIDASASMEDNATPGMPWPRNLRGSKWEAAVKAANVLVEESKSSDIGIVCFDSTNLGDIGVGSHRNDLSAFLQRMRPVGGTCFTVGLASSVNLLDDVDARPVQRVILLSDGYDGGHAGLRSWETLVERIRSRKVIVDTVGFGEADEERLRSIAEMFGGVYKHARDAKELVKQFKLLEASVRGLLGTG